MLCTQTSVRARITSQGIRKPLLYISVRLLHSIAGLPALGQRHVTAKHSIPVPMQRNLQASRQLRKPLVV